MATPQDQEVLEFLKRNEVRTMAKDIARLREEEAKKERERIEAIATEKPKPQPAQAQEQKAEPIEETIAPSGFERWKLTIPKPPSAFNKLLIRVLILAVLAFALLNLVLLWVGRTRTHGRTPSPPPVSVAQPLPAKPAPVEETKEEVLPAVFPLGSEQTVEVRDYSSLLPKLSQLLKEERSAGSLARIAFLSMPGGELLSGEEFFKGTGLQIPPRILASFSEKNLVPFVYAPSKGSGQRLGFVIELDQTEGLAEALAQWEPEMENSFEGFLSIQGSRDKAYAKPFKTAMYKEIEVRFQTWSFRDLGICYALVRNRLVFSSSLESIKAVIDKL